ncbi:MAG: radical SAM protein [Candidatus Lokiarchaeota archaeon]|nr:radical SAM protein [Candidatus Lokiarchaeota archaeon]MBD3201412.1 radical SAM protein [Candidatus Lokiarchaeota archaeon]
MDWEQETKELFKEVVDQIPDGFRPAVEPQIIKAAEQRCLDRNESYINTEDIVLGIFDIIPEAFKSMMVEDLTNLGIDVERYIELKEIKDRLKLSWDKLEKAFHPGVIHFAMYITDKCNMKCMHCAADDYTPRPELPKEEWFKIIENLESGLREHGRRGCYIWFGGEPTLRKDIGNIMAFCKENDYYHALITNGVEFDEEFAKMCKENNMSHVFVSFDSADPDKNDEIRGFPDSLKYAKKAVENCLKYGLFVCSSITVMKQNLDELDELNDLSLEWGAQPFFRPVVKQNRAAEYWDEIGLNQEEYQKLFKYKYEIAMKKINEGEAGTLPAYEIYEMMPFMACPRNDKERSTIEWGVGCLACRTMMGVGIDGTVFPTGYPTELTLGNAQEDSFSDILDSQIYKDIRDRKKIKGKCAECHHLELCGGGCRVTAEFITGDFFASFPFCWHENNHDHSELTEGDKTAGIIE